MLTQIYIYCDTKLFMDVFTFINVNCSLLLLRVLLEVVV